MAFNHSHRAWAAIVSGAILATGGMAMGAPEDPVRMSSLKIANIAGYEVLDLAGVRVGEITAVETDAQGRTRWLNIDLDAVLVLHAAHVGQQATRVLVHLFDEDPFLGDLGLDVAVGAAAHAHA